MIQYQPIIRTDRTYKTYANAEKSLKEATKNLEGKIDYLIAATPDGRFAPVVFVRQSSLLSACIGSLVSNGITVIG